MNTPFASRYSSSASAPSAQSLRVHCRAELSGLSHGRRNSERNQARLWNVFDAVAELIVKIRNAELRPAAEKLLVDASIVVRARSGPIGDT